MTTDGKKSLLYLHRLLLDAKPDQRIDHINGNRLDTRRENLRPVTARQNHQNQRRPMHTKSGHKGVYWHKAAGKWDARITLKGVRVHLGDDDDAEGATLMYAAVARRHVRAGPRMAPGAHLGRGERPFGENKRAVPIPPGRHDFRQVIGREELLR